MVTRPLCSGGVRDLAKYARELEGSSSSPAIFFQCLIVSFSEEKGTSAHSPPNRLSIVSSRPTDNDRYVRTAPSNPKKVCLSTPHQTVLRNI